MAHMELARHVPRSPVEFSDADDSSGSDTYSREPPAEGYVSGSSANVPICDDTPSPEGYVSGSSASVPSCDDTPPPESRNGTPPPSPPPPPKEAAEIFDSYIPMRLDPTVPSYFETLYTRFFNEKWSNVTRSIDIGRGNIHYLRKFIADTLEYSIMGQDCFTALLYLFRNYASEYDNHRLNHRMNNEPYKRSLGPMFDIIRRLLEECQDDISEQCEDCKRKTMKRYSDKLPKPKGRRLLPLFADEAMIDEWEKTTTPTITPMMTSTPKRFFRKMSAKVKRAFSKDREMMRISPFHEEYPEQLVDDSILIEDTPPRQISRSSSFPRFGITPPSPTDARARTGNLSSPDILTPPPRTPFISKSRFGFTDPTVPPGELNIPPGPFELPTPFRKTIALSSPKRNEPVLVNIGVDPKPLIDTERGERFVCDISIDVQSGQSGLTKKLPYARGLSSPYPQGTSAGTSRGRPFEMSVSPVIKRGRIRHDHITPERSGLYTPRIYRRPRRRRIPGSHPISELPWSPTYLPEDARSPVSGVTSPPYLSDSSISWERSADSYYGSSPDTPPVTGRPTRSPDFWDRSASPVIKRPTYGRSPTPPSPSPVIKPPPYGYRSPEFWSRPNYGYRTRNLDRSFSPYASETPDKYFSPDGRTPRTNMEPERHVLERSLYDPSVVNEACFLDDNYSPGNVRNEETERHFQRRSPYDPSVINEANFLDDPYFSPDRRTARSPYDPSVINEANFLDDPYFSTHRRTARSPYDPSVINEANFLDDPYFSSDRKTARSPYDPSVINEANFLDDPYFSPDRRTARSPYDPSVINEANFLDDPYFSPDRRTTSSPYDPSVINEANFLDDPYFSPDRRTARSPYDPSIINEENILDD